MSPAGIPFNVSVSPLSPHCCPCVLCWGPTFPLGFTLGSPYPHVPLHFFLSPISSHSRSAPHVPPHNVAISLPSAVFPHPHVPISPLCHHSLTPQYSPHVPPCQPPIPPQDPKFPCSFMSSCIPPPCPVPLKSLLSPYLQTLMSAPCSCVPCVPRVTRCSHVPSPISVCPPPCPPAHVPHPHVSQSPQSPRIPHVQPCASPPPECGPLSPSPPLLFPACPSLVTTVTPLATREPSVRARPAGGAPRGGAPAPGEALGWVPGWHSPAPCPSVTLCATPRATPTPWAALPLSRSQCHPALPRPPVPPRTALGTRSSGAGPGVTQPRDRTRDKAPAQPGESQEQEQHWDKAPGSAQR